MKSDAPRVCEAVGIGVIRTRPNSSRASALEEKINKALREALDGGVRPDDVDSLSKAIDKAIHG